MGTNNLSWTNGDVGPRHWAQVSVTLQTKALPYVFQKTGYGKSSEAAKADALRKLEADGSYRQHVTKQ
jgi:type IV secretory pathway TrbF-like protein